MFYKLKYWDFSDKDLNLRLIYFWNLLEKKIEANSKNSLGVFIFKVLKQSLF